MTAAAQPGRMDPARRTPGPRRAGPWLPLVLLCGCIPARSSDAAPSLRPTIIAPLGPVRSPPPGRSWQLSCQAQSVFPGMTLLYWLANGSFVEDRYPGGAVREGDVGEQPNGTGVLLTRELRFEAFSWRDRRTAFTCVARNPGGLATAPLRWEPERPGGGRGPQPERREAGGSLRGSASVDRTAVPPCGRRRRRRPGAELHGAGRAVPAWLVAPAQLPPRPQQ